MLSKLSTASLCRYFYATLNIGTPPQPYSTIIDTGSTITYLPCSNCRHCGDHTVSNTEKEPVTGRMAALQARAAVITRDNGIAKHANQLFP